MSSAELIKDFNNVVKGAEKVETKFGLEFERKLKDKKERFHLFARKGQLEEDEFYLISAKKIDYLLTQRKWRDDYLVYNFSNDAIYKVKVDESFSYFNREKHTFSDNIEREYVAIPSEAFEPFLPE